ncbi:hypothetical protein AAVH_28859 [Aphelenchoides avenae]|nr:hypothetical protein AAVH_28859 [Aphelenchus avenae]
MDQTEELQEKLERESQALEELGRSLKAAKKDTERAKAELRTTADEASELNYQLEKEHVNAQKERTNLEEALRSEMETDKSRILQLQQSLEDFRVKFQHRTPSDEALRLKEQVKRNAVNFEKEKKAMEERHQSEMEKADVRIRRLRQDISQARAAGVGGREGSALADFRFVKEKGN